MEYFNDLKDLFSTHYDGKKKTWMSENEKTGCVGFGDTEHQSVTNCVKALISSLWYAQENHQYDLKEEMG